MTAPPVRLRGQPTPPPPARPGPATTAYAVVLLATCVGIIAAGWTSIELIAGLFWIPVIAVANLSEVEALPELEVDASLASIFIVAAAVLLPPAGVTLFVLLGLVYRRELRGQAPLVMSVFNRSQLALSGALASAAAGTIMTAMPAGVVRTTAMTLVAVVVTEVANTVFLALVLMVRRGRRLREAAAEAANPFPRFALNAGVSTLLALLIVLLVRDVGQWAVALMAIPFWLSHSAQKSAREAQDRAEELAARVGELEMLNRLSRDLLSVRSVGDVSSVAGSTLAETLGARTVALHTDGAAPEGRGEVVAVAGAQPASLVVEYGDDEHPPAVLEAAAALIGLALTRLELEAELAANERARAALAGRILEEATHERNRIALELHDDVLPLFAAAQMKVDMLDLAVERADPDQAHSMIEGATQAVEQGIAALRDTLEALRRSTLVPGSLVEALQRLIAELPSRSGVRGELAAPDPMPPLPFTVELLVYETMRGCIANVEKHSEASTVWIELSDADGKLVALMRDDGRGFDPTTIGQRSHGLALIRQRAELARGRFDICSSPGDGTSVRLEVPIW